MALEFRIAFQMCYSDFKSTHSNIGVRSSLRAYIIYAQAKVRPWIYIACVAYILSMDKTLSKG